MGTIVSALKQTTVTPSALPESANDWGNTLYTGAQEIGVFKAELILAVGVVVASVMAVIALIMAFSDDSNKYIWLKGTIVEPNCTKTSVTYNDKGHAVETYKCNMTVEYKVNGNVYQKRLYLTGNETYIKDEPIGLVVMKSDPNNVQLSYTDGTTMAGMLFVSSIAIVSMAYLNYYMTNKYNLFAAAQGTSSVVGLFR
jgi:hypothetical protein